MHTDQILGERPWWRAGIIITFLALAMCVLAAWNVQQTIARGNQTEKIVKLQARLDTADTLRESEARQTKQAASIAKVQACTTAARNAPSVRRFFDALDSIVANQVLSTSSALEADPGGPLASVRRESLGRLTSTQRDLRKFRRQTNKRTPNLQSCIDLARVLKVPVPPKPAKPAT